MAGTGPVKLTSPRVWRTYVGGSRIDAIHGIGNSPDGQFPEEWIMSTVNARNVGREHITDEGLCYLVGTDRSLRDYIAGDPEGVLGKKHVEKLGNTTGVLVKILDSAERLTIQAHPNKQRAMELFQSPFGKTECWHILDTRTIDGQVPCIYLGFKEGITRERWKHLFDTQNIPEMLGCLHCFPVKPGETYLINGGVPHAIGPGCLLVEIQEPTDFTVRTERVTPKGLRIQDAQCHQGLGFDKMFDCFIYEGLSLEDAGRRWRIGHQILEKTEAVTHSLLIGGAQTPCFRLERYDVSGSCRLDARGVISGLYVYAGSGSLSCAGHRETCVPGDQFFLGADCPEITVEGDLTLFRCFGPELE